MPAVDNGCQFVHVTTDAAVTNAGNLEAPRLMRQTTTDIVGGTQTLTIATRLLDTSSTVTVGDASVNEDDCQHTTTVLR